MDSAVPPRYSVTLEVEHYLHGVRIDSFLEKHFRSYTSWRLLRMVRAGAAEVEGRMATCDQRVFTGQLVRFTLLEPPDNLIPAEPVPLEVIHEDRWLVIINKPAGMIAHPTGEIPHGTLINAMQHHLDAQSSWKGLLKPGVVHRLDRDTSGVIALAKHHLSHRLLSIEFQRERVSKAYLAIVHGVIREEELIVDRPIGRMPGMRSALMTCRTDAVDAQPAKTLVNVVERFANHTLVRAKPRTGRMHQIRVHLATAGYPLVGDEFYGPGGAIIPLKEEGSPPVSSLIPRQALHAAELCFSHPITRVWSDYQAPLPPDFESLLSRLRESRESG